MNALARWNPIREMEDMHRRISSIMDGNPLRRSTLTGGGRKHDGSGMGALGGYR